jgi:hypothetical protein
MRKLLTLLLICGLAGVVSANDLHVRYANTMTAADTLAFCDSSYSEWHDVSGASKLHFYALLIPYLAGGVDTNMGADTFFVNAQLSFNKRHITKTLELDTFLTTDSGWTGLLTSDGIAGDSLRGCWMRALLIHKDTTNLPGTMVGSTYSKQLYLFYEVKK